MGKDIVVVAGNRHLKIRSTGHHRGHTISTDLDLTSGNVIKAAPQISGDLFAGALALFVGDQVQNDGGGFLVVGSIETLEFRAVLLGNGNNTVTVFIGGFQFRAGGHGDIDVDHALIHIWHQDYVGPQTAAQEDQDQCTCGKQGLLLVVQAVVQYLHVLFREKSGVGLPLGVREPILQQIQADLVLFQQEIAHEGNQGQGNDQREDDQKHNSDSKIPEDHAGQTTGQTNGKKDCYGGQGRGCNGQNHFLGAQDAAFESAVAVTGVTVDIFQNNDGIIHHHTHADGDTAQADHVQGDIADIQHQHNSHHTEGHGEGDGGGGAQPAQEEEDHQSRQGNTGEDVLQGGINGVLNVIAGIIGDEIAHRGNVLVELSQRLRDPVHDLHFIGARLLVDAQDDAAVVIDPGRAVLHGRIQVTSGNLTQTDGTAGGEEEKGI